MINVGPTGAVSVGATVGRIINVGPAGGIRLGTGEAVAVGSIVAVGNSVAVGRLVGDGTGVDVAIKGGRYSVLPTTITSVCRQFTCMILATEVPVLRARLESVSPARTT